MSVSTESTEISCPESVEDECSALKQFLSDVIKDRAALKEEFDQLTESRQLMVEQMEDDEDDSNEDEEQSDARVLAYQAEKKQLDEKLRILEEKLSLKDKQMAELDLKATEYLHRVTTSSNSLFDEEELESATGASCDAEDKANAQVNKSSSNAQIDRPQEIPNIGSSLTGEAAEVSGKLPVSKESYDPFGSDVKDGDKKPNIGVVPVEEIISLSNLVSELKTVKDEMGRCMSVKTKSFAELEDELVASKRNQALLEQQVASMLERLNAKETLFQTLVKENETFKEALASKSKEHVLSEESPEKRDGIQSKEKSVGKMAELGSGARKDSGDKKKAGARSIALVHTNGEIIDKNRDTSDLEDSDDRSLSEEKDSPIESSAENLDSLPPDDVFDDYSILEEQNKKLSAKLRSTGRYLKALTRDRELKRKECEVLQEKVQLVEGKMLQLQGSFDTLVAAVMTERDELLKDVENKRGEIDRLTKVVELQADREKTLLENIEEAEKKAKNAEISTEARETMRKAFEDELSSQKASLENRIKSLQDESLRRENELSNKIAEVEDLNKKYASQISQLQAEAEKLTINKEQTTAVKTLTEKLQQKEEECKILEDRLETQNDEMNDFVTCLKDEMTRMKEDMMKQSEARLQLEDSYDTLMETNREVLFEKNKLEEASVELSIALNDQKNHVESLKEQVEDLSRKNTALSCEFHEKEDEYNDELKARDATIQELRKTLTNNQKQSSENYRCLQEDLAALQLKLSSQIEESKSTVNGLEQQCAILQKTKGELESKLEESYQLIETIKSENDAAMKAMSSKLEELEISKDAEIKNLKCSLESLGQTSQKTANIVKGNDDPKNELLTSWSGSLEELECELSCAKDELIRFVRAGQESLAGSADESAQNSTKIALMVRRVEELSSVLAVTRLGCGAGPLATTCETDVQKTEAQSLTRQAIISDTESRDTDVTKEETQLGKSDKASNTWCPFKTQAEFEKFVSDKEQKIECFEKQVNELENSLSTKHKYIEELEEKLQAAKTNSNESFESHLNAVKQLNVDISVLKEELERSHSECDSLKSTIALLKSSESEPKVKSNEPAAKEIDAQIVKKDDEVEQGASSDAQESELKKNLVERLKLIVSALENRSNQDRVAGDSSKLDDVVLCPVAEQESSLRVVCSSDSIDRQIVTREDIQAVLDCCAREENVLQQKITELEEKLSEMSSRNSTMEKKLKLTENKVGVLNEVKRKLMDYTRTLEDKLQSSDDSRVASLTEKKATMVKVDDLLAEIQGLKEHIDELNVKCDSLLIEKSKESKMYEETQAENERLSKKILEIQDEKHILETLRSQCTNYKQKLLDLEEENSELANKCKALNSRIIDLETIESQQKTHVDSLIKEKQVLQNEYDNLRSKIKSDEFSSSDDKKKKEAPETAPAGVETLQVKCAALKSSNENKGNSGVVSKGEGTEKSKGNVSDEGPENQERSSKDEKLALLREELEKLSAEKEALVKAHKEEQQNMLEMQNMMVADMEKLILSLESEKNTLSESKDNMYVELKSFKEENSALSSRVSDLNATVKYLQDRLHGLETEKCEFKDQYAQLRKILEGLRKTDDVDSVSFSNASKALASQLTILDEKLGPSDAPQRHQESGLRSKSSSVADVSSLQQKINDLRRDLTAELDFVESRKDEETQRLEQKFVDLETEFQRKLAETREYYESVMEEEKAEFGRLLVTRVSEYEKKLSEKCDEISGWEVKLLSMQEELDNKMIVIEELETRLDERSTPRLDRRSLPQSSPTSLHHGQASSLNEEKFLAIDLQDPASNVGENKNPSAISDESELPSCQQAIVTETASRQRPILSLVMSSSYSNIDGVGSRSPSGDSLKIIGDELKQGDLQNIATNPKTAVFISRDFPSTSTLQSAVQSLELASDSSQVKSSIEYDKTPSSTDGNKIKLSVDYDSDSSSESSQDETVAYAIGLPEGPASPPTTSLSPDGPLETSSPYLTSPSDNTV